MSIFLEEDGKTSTNCYRKHHESCTVSSRCICMCHVVKQKNEELKKNGTLKTADEFVNRLLLGSGISARCRHKAHGSCLNTKGWCRCKCHGEFN